MLKGFAWLLATGLLVGGACVGESEPPEGRQSTVGGQVVLLG